MVKFANDSEKVQSAQPGKYLFKIYECVEKTSQNGNDYLMIKFESKEGIKVCDTFMFGGKAAGKTLNLLTALGLADGENFPKKDIDVDDILGKILYIDVVKDKDSEFLKCPWGSSGYEAYKKNSTKKEVEKEEVEECPF